MTACRSPICRRSPDLCTCGAMAEAAEAAARPPCAAEAATDIDAAELPPLPRWATLLGRAWQSWPNVTAASCVAALVVLYGLAGSLDQAAGLWW